jgi:ubiquinone/menaquinone biosynthesis C-methylase UbiE
MSVSFDRIAAHYDATRGFPVGVDSKIGPAFRRHSGLPGGARLLEIGVGTGRIAIPLASVGYRYVGLDLSLNMMARLREHMPPGVAVELARGDATALPLHDSSVDGAVVVHVFHLIDGWERAVAELRRVIRPGGVLATGFNETAAPLPADSLRERWRDIVQELGGDTSLPGARLKHEEPLLISLFGPVHRTTLATWTRRESLRERLNLMATRANSDTWKLPEPILRESIHQAEAWARATYGDLERQDATEARFTMLFYEKRAT